MSIQYRSVELPLVQDEWTCLWKDPHRDSTHQVAPPTCMHNQQQLVHGVQRQNLENCMGQNSGYTGNSLSFVSCPLYFPDTHPHSVSFNQPSPQSLFTTGREYRRIILKAPNPQGVLYSRDSCRMSIQYKSVELPLVQEEWTCLW